MSLFLKNSNAKSSKSDLLTLAFFKELSKKKEGSSKKTIQIETDSGEIAEIISERLLEKIQEKIVMK